MRVLFIAEPGSVHAARWIEQFRHTGWDVHVYAATGCCELLAPSLDFGTLYASTDIRVPPGLRFVRLPEAPDRKAVVANLAALIETIRPDVVHSLGLCVNWENRALPVALAKEILGDRFGCPWIYSSWGADLDFFARDKHTEDVGFVMARADFHISECARDEELARRYGFQGVTLPRMPAFGGVTWGHRRITTKPSERRLIVWKGRDVSDGDPIGRALSIVFALMACAPHLQGYQIRALQAGPEVTSWIERLRQTTGLDVAAVSRLPEHTQVLDIVAQARLFISMTINDGLPSTLVESMSLGAFPIHSDLPHLSEWVSHGSNGFLVDLEDIGALADAIRHAVSDDALIDQAAEVNAHHVANHLSEEVVRPRAIQVYQDVLHHWRRSSRQPATL